MVSDVNITDAIFAVAERSPHALSIIDGENRLGFQELCASVRIAANRFREAGWRAGDVIGISLGGSQIGHLVSSLALARSGMVQFSLPVGGPAPLLMSRIRKLGIRGIVSDASAEGGITTVVPGADWFPSAATDAIADDWRDAGGDRLWAITETSGTTGEPKLVGISHAVEDAHRRSRAPIFSHLPAERYLNLTGVRFLTGMKRAICCLSDGGVLAFPPAGFSFCQLLDWIDRHDVRYISCVPVHLHQLLREVDADGPRLPALRILLSSTAAFPPALVDEVRKRISPNFYFNYGASETGPMAAATPEMLAAHPDSVGKPLDGIELEIVDDAGRLRPAGVTGHVRVRGPGVLTAYWRADPAEQARVFRAGWCYPGDLGCIDENGLLFLKGRADDTMNFDGIMIGPVEIEAVLGLHPAVIEVAAFALPSTEHQDVPAAAIVSAQPLQVDELARFCAERLGVRAPRLFLRVEAIPKNAMGKVLRRELVRIALAILESAGPA